MFFEYTFGAEKTKKLVIIQDSTGVDTITRLYIGGFEFVNDEPEFFSIGEGRIVLKDTSFQFRIADHLGNTVVLFEDKDDNGTISTLVPQNPEDAEVVQRNLYYPFGLALEGTWNDLTNPREDYLYNGKELEEELRLNWYSYGARMYDPAIGRFPSVDPIADQFAWASPFNYAENEPVGHVDLWGLQQGDAPMPSVAGIFYEAWQNANAGMYNLLMFMVEPPNSPIKVRKRVNYNADGSIPLDEPTKIVLEERGNVAEELVDIGLDVLSLSPLAEFGAAKGATIPIIAMAKTPSSIIPAIAKQFKNLHCADCADAIVDALKKEGISGEIITLQANQTKRGFIFSETADKIISENGMHRGVLVDGKIYDNIHTEGIDYDDWLKDFDVFGGFKEPTKTDF
jgi:RHS repeat-associated protein